MLGDCLYLDNVREFVEDENRIVSYKWLSRKLEVPADAAKKMLYAYAEHSSGKEGVTVTYAITGVKDTSQGKLLEVSLVKEEELEAAKNALQSVRGVHIYSVQKTRIQDSSTLFSADYDICKEHISTYSRWSPISCSEPLPPFKTEPYTHTQRRMRKEIQFPRLDLKREQGHQKEGADAKAPKEKEPLKDTTKSSTSAAKPLPRKLDCKKVSESRQKNISRGGVASYFTSTQTMKAKSEAKSSVKKIGGCCINDSDINDSSDSGGESVVPAAPRPKTSMKVTQGKKAVDNSAKVHQAPLQRKRKRIQNTMSSDEEDSMPKKEGKNKAEEAVGKRRKRVKRLKSRMYTTDDGAMVTEKVWQSESTDESDSDTRPQNRGVKKAPVAAVKTVQNSPAKGTRQSLLSNFFKK